MMVGLRGGFQSIDTFGKLLFGHCRGAGEQLICLPTEEKHQGGIQYIRGKSYFEDLAHAARRHGVYS